MKQPLQPLLLPGVRGFEITWINHFLDHWVRPHIQVGGHFWRAFELCAYTGLILGLLLVVTLTMQAGLLLWVMLVIGLSAVLASLGVIMANKIIFNVERLVYYHFQIAVIGTATLLLWGLHQPILPYLDIMGLGLGLCLACTRIGCLMAGCCHGRPHTWGVCYGQSHASAGFTPYYVNVRLFPIQAVESLWVFGLVLIGSILCLRHALPGTVLAWYVVAYGGGRFCFEFIRGDASRPYCWGFSQAQWISGLLIAITVGLETIGLLPFYWWHVSVLMAAILVAIALTLYRRFDRCDRYHLLHPQHVKEIAVALELIPNLSAEKFALSTHRGKCTSLGIELFASIIQTDTGPTVCYTLARQQKTMTKAMAKTIENLILQLTPSASSQLIEKNPGLFHLLIQQPAPKSDAHS